jgi:hypothetical protein
MDTSSNTETRLFVKIRFSESGYSALATVHYFRNEMKVDFFHRWMWYFKYREALLRVAHPKAFIEFEAGPYQYVLPQHALREKVKNKHLSNKRQLTKFDNQLSKICANWNEIFPIEEHPNWIDVQRKRDYYKQQLQVSAIEYDNLFNANDKFTTQ